jgi:hypothetical protein
VVSGRRPGLFAAPVLSSLRPWQPGRDADREPASPASTSAAAGPAALEERVRAHLGGMERRLEATLQHISHELATEVGREQNHLILMQDQARTVRV